MGWAYHKWVKWGKKGAKIVHLISWVPSVWWWALCSQPDTGMISQSKWMLHVSRCTEASTHECCTEGLSIESMNSGHGVCISMEHIFIHPKHLWISWTSHKYFLYESLSCLFRWSFWLLGVLWFLHTCASNSKALQTTVFMRIRIHFCRKKKNIIYK